MNKRETNLIADLVIRPDFGHRNLHILAETARNIDHRHRNVQVKLRAEPGKGGPLRHRLEMIDRLCGFDLHDPEELPAPTVLENQVRIPGRRPANRRRLLVPRIDRNFELSLIFRLELANDAVVLELLADRPHENWAHTTSDTCTDL